MFTYYVKLVLRSPVFLTHSHSQVPLYWPIKDNPSAYLSSNRDMKFSLGTRPCSMKAHWFINFDVLHAAFTHDLGFMWLVIFPRRSGRCRRLPLKTTPNSSSIVDTRAFRDSPSILSSKFRALKVLSYCYKFSLNPVEHRLLE